MEVWKDIPGYEGKYQASSYGQIRSLDRLIIQESRKGNLHHRSIKGRILRPGRYCKSGHVSVVLGHGTSGIPVHQLIALTFIGPCPDKLDILHKDGNPTNNRLENLRYDSRTENIIDVLRIGKAWRKLTLAQVKEIKRRLTKGEKGSILAREFKVSQTSISSIKNGRTFWYPEAEI